MGRVWSSFFLGRKCFIWIVNTQTLLYMASLVKWCDVKWQNSGRKREKGGKQLKRHKNQPLSISACMVWLQLWCNNTTIFMFLQLQKWIWSDGKIRNQPARICTNVQFLLCHKNPEPAVALLDERDVQYILKGAKDEVKRPKGPQAFLLLSRYFKIKTSSNWGDSKMV